MRMKSSTMPPANFRMNSRAHSSIRSTQVSHSDPERISKLFELEQLNDIPITLDQNFMNNFVIGPAEEKRNWSFETQLLICMSMGRQRRLAAVAGDCGGRSWLARSRRKICTHHRNRGCRVLRVGALGCLRGSPPRRHAPLSS